MKLRVTKAEVWSAAIQDQPGALAGALESLAGAGADLEFLVARRQPGQSGTGLVFVTPLKARKVRTAAAELGFRASERIATLRIEGPDKPGLGARIARVVGNAGVNMRGVSGAVIGRRFVCFIGFDSSADAARAAAALRHAKR